MRKMILIAGLAFLCLLTGCTRPDTIDPSSMAGLIGDRADIATLAYDAASVGNIRGWVELPGQEGAAVLDLLYGIDMTQFAPTEESFLGGSAELRLTAGYGSRQLTLVNAMDAQYLVLRTEENQVLQYKGPVGSFDFITLRGMLQTAAQVIDDPERCAVASAPGRSDTVTLSRKNTALATAIIDTALLDNALAQEEPAANYDLELRLGETLWQLDSATGACARWSGDTIRKGRVSGSDLSTLRLRCGLGALME